LGGQRAVPGLEGKVLGEWYGEESRYVGRNGEAGAGRGRAEKVRSKLIAQVDCEAVARQCCRSSGMRSIGNPRFIAAQLSDGLAGRVDAASIGRWCYRNRGESRCRVETEPLVLVAPP
jgi:hypothetical protein